MANFKFQFREQYQHPDVVVSLDASLAFAAPSIQTYFEDRIRQGARFHAGETVQFGWMIVLLKANGRDDLEIWEPRLGTVPIEWVRGISETYRQLMVQKAVCDQLGVDPVFPSIRQSAVVFADFAASQRLRMHRAGMTDTESGWMLASDETGEDTGPLASLFEIASKRPDVIPFFALPVGASAVLASDKTQIELDGTVVDSDSKDFLRRLLQG